MKRIQLNKMRLKQIVNESIKSFLQNKVYSYKLQNLDKLYEYMRLDKKRSGLNVDIFVDDCKSYKHYNHPLLVFVKNTGKEYIPISVSRHPKILDNDIQIKIPYEDLKKIKKFISTNVKIIRDYANERIAITEFIQCLNKVDHGLMEEHKSLINEMATLKRNISGLPMDLWLDDNRLYASHAPRVKFRASNEQRTTHEFSSMLITNPDQIENMPRRSNIKERDMRTLKQFVIANRDALLALANSQIDYAEFLQRMIKV